jgi:hypothetical protein
MAIFKATIFLLILILILIMVFIIINNMPLYKNNIPLYKNNKYGGNPYFDTRKSDFYAYFNNNNPSSKWYWDWVGDSNLAEILALFETYAVNKHIYSKLWDILNNNFMDNHELLLNKIKTQLGLIEDDPIFDDTSIFEADGTIIIYNKRIRQISGPISFYYLKPKQSTITNYFPLIILFGDQHRSFDHICNPCNTENSCYRIDSKEFLQVIDKLGTLGPNIAIDFYIESSFYGMGNGFLNGPMDYFTNFSRPDNISTCYDRSLIGTPEYLENCPTKNIRWHHSDARFFGNLENYTNKEISPITKHYIAENHSFETKLFNTAVEISKSIMVRTDNNMENYNPLLQIDSYGNPIFTLSEFRHIISSHMLVDGEIDIRGFLIYLFEQIFLDSKNIKSTLKKEYEKLSEEKKSIFNFSAIIEIYVEEFLTNSVLPPYDRPPNLSYLNIIINDFLDKEDIKDISFQYIGGIIIKILYFLIDLYTIFRIFKNIEPSSIPSTISFIYLGNSHIKLLKKILSTCYDCAQQIINYSDELRCIDFKYSQYIINLNNDILDQIKIFE